MVRVSHAALLAVALCAALACAEGKDKFKLIHVQDLTAMQADKQRPVFVFDANEPDFRQKNGVIPGAKLLSSFNHYDVAKELPSEKNARLVFYCTSSH